MVILLISGWMVVVSHPPGARERKKLTCNFGTRVVFQEVSRDIRSRDVTNCLTALHTYTPLFKHRRASYKQRATIDWVMAEAEPVKKKQQARKSLSEDQRKRNRDTDRAISQTRVNISDQLFQNGENWEKQKPAKRMLTWLLLHL